MQARLSNFVELTQNMNDEWFWNFQKDSNLGMKKKEKKLLRGPFGSKNEARENALEALAEKLPGSYEIIPDDPPESFVGQATVAAGPKGLKRRRNAGHGHSGGNGFSVLE